MKAIVNRELNSDDLRKMSLKELVNMADSMATRLQWLHSTGKNETDPDKYKRLASELYHLAQIIEVKEIERSQKKKGNKYH